MRGRRVSIALLVPLMVTSCSATTPIAHVSPPRQWPTLGWETASPESRGLDSEVLAKAVETIHERRLPVHSLAIVRDGALVVDACFHPYDCSVPHDVASVTKSVTSTLVGIALDEGAIESLEAPVASFFPEVDVGAMDRRKTRVRIADLLTMRSGLACGLEPGERELYAMLESPDWAHFVLGLPMTADPGASFAYCSGGMHLLSSIVSRATGVPAQDFARARLFAPLGISTFAWPLDPMGVAHGWGDLKLFPHDMLKLGLLVLQGGRWHGKQVVSTHWLGEATRARVQAGKDGYGYGWWLPSGAFQGAIEARGRGGQSIAIWPARNLVAALTGAGYSSDEVVALLADALRSDSPLPPNPSGEERLAQAVARAHEPPPRHAVPPLPATAATVSARRYRLDRNRLDLGEIAVSFSGPATAAVDLVRSGTRYPLEVGLDGVERIAPIGPAGSPVASTGEWIDEDTFRIHYEDAAAMNRFTISLRFTGGGAGLDLMIEDPAHLFDLAVTGHAWPPIAVADP